MNYSTLVDNPTPMLTQATLIKLNGSLRKGEAWMSEDICWEGKGSMNELGRVRGGNGV